MTRITYKFGLLFIAVCGFFSIDVLAQRTEQQKQVDSLIKSSKDNVKAKQFDVGMDFAEQASQLAIELFGENSLEYNDTQIQTAAVFSNMTKRDSAEDVLRSVTDYFEHGGDKKSGTYVRYRAMIAYFVSKDDLNLATVILDEILKIANEILPEDDEDRLHVLKFLALCKHRTGKFTEASELYESALTVLRSKHGDHSPELQPTLGNLVLLCNDMGDYLRAKKYNELDVPIAKDAYGPKSVEYLHALNSKAVVHFQLGLNAEAEEIWLEVQSLLLEIYGKDHIQYIGNVVNLGNLYTQLRQLKRAESMYLSAYQFFVEHKEYAAHKYFSICVMNLGGIYIDLRNYKEAEKYLEEGLVRTDKEFGVGSHLSAQLETALESTYIHSKNYAKAEELAESVLVRYETNGLKGIEIHTLHLLNLATARRGLGNYEGVDSILSEVRGYHVTNSGIDNLRYCQITKDLAMVYELMDKMDEANKLNLEVNDILKKVILRDVHHLSENELQAYYSRFYKYQEYMMDQSLKQPQNMDLASACYDNALFYKGFLQNSACQVRNGLTGNKDAYLKYQELREICGNLAAQYSAPVNARKDVSAVEAKKEALEKEIANLSVGYSEAMNQVDWKEVRSSLSAGEAAIEFMQFESPDGAGSVRRRYAALVLNKEMQNPVLVSLCLQEELDAFVADGGVKKGDYVNNLYQLSNRGLVEGNTPTTSLAELIWDPIVPYLNKVDKIYYSPSASLHLINLTAIPISEDHTLSDKFSMIQLNSTRQLVEHSSGDRKLTTASLFGGIEYERLKSLPNSEELSLRGVESISFGATDSTLRGGSWNYLPGTMKEVQGIETVLKNSGFTASLYTGENGAEEKFKSICAFGKNSPEVLHIATHGYFFPDAKNDSTSVSLSEESVFSASEHPMLRSGLILAGGNTSWKNGTSTSGVEDGILTSYEISQLNLSNTELVVLSACETGLGMIQDNEGVYGLQRAFKIAGAKYIIMSLWQVPDKQTSMLMTTFYKKWLEEKMTIPDAFHAAQKELRDMGFDPYQWAGFVLVE